MAFQDADFDSSPAAHFGLEFQGIQIKAITEVSGLKMEQDVIELKENGPDGKYVILEYESAFEKKSSAVETVVPMVDPDGTWRVSGYFIR